MISLEFVIEIHTHLINRFGGVHGVRDITLVESAIARPFQTFDSIELYPTPIEKAASILESILINHPFVDGNKRTGYVLMRILLLQGNLIISASKEDKYEFVIKTAQSIYQFSEISEWLIRNTKLKE